jgi:hypothetical protein
MNIKSFGFEELDLLKKEIAIKIKMLILNIPYTLHILYIHYKPPNDL